MARDLNKFLAEHRKSHTRYISSVDSLIERYEDVSEDEMENVVNLSSCKIVKDKKGMFRRGRCFGSMFHLLDDNDKSTDCKVSEKREKVGANKEKSEARLERVLLSSESDGDSDTEKRNMDYRVLKDVSSCVASFLEDGEPEPSDGETLSSTSTDSYETILSEFEDETTQESDSQPDLEYSHAGKQGAEENIYDEIDGSMHEKFGEVIHQDAPDDSRYTQPCLPNKAFDRNHRNTKTVQRRADETFIIEDHVKSVVNDMNSGVNRSTGQMRSRANPPECNNNALVKNYGIQHSDIKRTNYHAASSQRMNVKRVSTEFVPFNDLRNSDKGEVIHKSNEKESPSTNNPHRDHFEDDLTENTMFSSLDSRYLSYNKADQIRYEVKDKIEHEINKLDKVEYVDNVGDSNIVTKKQNLEWLFKKFSPKQRSEQRGIQNNDLSPSHRKRVSRKSAEKFRNMATEHESLGSYSRKEISLETNDAVKMVTPFHHKQARKIVASNLMSSPLQQSEMYVTNSAETEYDSLHDNNRSSKKDSGFSTLHDESLTIDTPSYEEIPEILTLENLDSFNKSMAEQSSFVNVSVNCSDNRLEEKTEKVEKWLHDISVEMEKETETTIDRKVDRISKEMCRNGQGGISVMGKGMVKNNRNRKDEVNRQRHNSAEITKKTEGLFKTVVSKSCVPLQKSPRSNINSDICKGSASNIILQNRGNPGHGDRHTLRGHRTSTQNFYQRIEKENIAELMKMFRRKDEDNYHSEVTKQRHSEFSGKRLIDTPNDFVYMENEVDGMPTPPKSRRLNENVTGPFKNRFENENLHSLKKYHKSPGHRKYENLVENYNENDCSDDFPLEKQEMLSYMIQRDFAKQALHNKDEFEEVRQTRRRVSSDNIRKENSSNQERARIDSRHKQYQNDFDAVEDVNERDHYTSVVRDRLQTEMKSPSNQSRSSTHRDGREVHSPYTYHQNQYEVNQSYIRKLKQTSRKTETDDRLESQNYVEIDEESDDEYERNKDLAREETIDYQQSAAINSRHRQPYRQETNQRDGGNNFELNEKRFVAQRYGDLREEHDSDPREYRIQVDRQYQQKRTENKHVDVNREMLYKWQDRGNNFEESVVDRPLHQKRPENEYADVETDLLYKRQSRGVKKFEDNSAKTKYRGKSRERTERLMYKDMRSDTPDKLKNIRNDMIDNVRPENHRHFVRERYLQEANVQDSFNNVVSQDEEVYETNSVSPRTEIKRYHMQCHLGSPHWQRSRHVKKNYIEARSPDQQRNNNAAFRDNSNPEYSSPLTRQEMDTRYMDFNSPVIEKTKRTVRTKQDEYSPSASLARMRLNTPKSKSGDRMDTPKSKSEDRLNTSKSKSGDRLNTPKSKSGVRQRQHRERESMAQNFETDNENYQAVFYTSNDVRDNWCVDKTEMNVNDSHKEFLRKNMQNFGKRVDNLEKERGDIELLEDSSETTYQGQSSPRFVSLDQIRGMPLQLRIQQLESDHAGIERLAGGRRLNANRECSNEYICENSGRDSHYYENEQKESLLLENERSSNVYHKYCEVINDKDQLSNRSPDIGSPEGNGDTNERRTPRSTDEPKMRKSLFSPVSANFGPTAMLQDRRTVIQSDKDFGVFKTPMSPPVVAKSKPNKHNKENEHNVDKISQQKSKFATSEIAKPRDRLSNIHASSGSVKLTPAQYMQSTPIKPGIQFTMNTTMSTIMGSDETEINNDVNDEIILI